MARRQVAGLSIRGCGFECHPRKILVSVLRSISGFYSDQSLNLVSVFVAEVLHVGLELKKRVYASFADWLSSVIAPEHGLKNETRRAKHKQYI